MVHTCQNEVWLEGECFLYLEIDMFCAFWLTGVNFDSNMLHTW